MQKILEPDPVWESPGAPEFEPVLVDADLDVRRYRTFTVADRVDDRFPKRDERVHVCERVASPVISNRTRVFRRMNSIASSTWSGNRPAIIRSSTIWCPFRKTPQWIVAWGSSR